MAMLRLFRIAFLSLRVWEVEGYDMKEEEEEEEEEKERCRRRRRRTRGRRWGQRRGGWARKGWKAKTVNVPLPLFLSRWIMAMASES